MPSGDGITSSRIDSAALAAVTLACALALMLLSGPFIWLASIGGLILLLVLIAYDQEGYRSIFQSLVYAAVCGFCLSVASAAIFKLRTTGDVTAVLPQIAGTAMPLTWAFGTLLFCVIDRARMSGRVAIPAQSSARTTTQRTFFTQAPSPPVQPAYMPPPAYAPQPAYAPPPPPPPPQPVYTPPPQPVQPAYAPAPTPQPAYQPAQSYPAEPIAPPAPPPQPVYTEPPPPEPAPTGFIRPPSASIIPTPGREASIYIALVGEGLNVLRSVRAEHLGRDFYKIIEPVPEGETWEYQPGQVVRCKKKNLSTGKGLVAVEEAPRAS